MAKKDKQESEDKNYCHDDYEVDEIIEEEIENLKFVIGGLE